MTLQAVQVYRGLAVLLVVLFHGGGYVRDKFGAVPLGDVFRIGYCGVFLFFVISGFIILTAHRKDVGQPARFGHYMSRRVVRVYPLYWLVLLVWGGWHVFTGGLSPEILLSNALWFSAPVKLMVPVSWTMRYEMLFYAIFAVCIVNRDLGRAVMAGWLGWIVIGPIMKPLSPVAWFIEPLNLLFLVGLCVAALQDRWASLGDVAKNRIGWSCLVAGVLSFGLTGAVCWWMPPPVDAWPRDPVAIIGFGGSSALLLMASLAPAVNEWCARVRVLGLIGNASYSIYLTHIQFSKTVFGLIRPFEDLWKSAYGSTLLSNLALAILASFVVLAGIAVHLTIEVPLLSWLRAKFALTPFGSKPV